ncbi:ATP-binding protein, partial [Streptomyces sp. Act-28]
MGDLDAPKAPVRRFPPEPRSAARARRFVRAALAGVAPDLVDTAELLAGELVTNAVLHARTEVEVSAGVVDGRVRVRISDRRPSRMPVARECSPYTGTGQGLALVDRLASRYGVETGEDAKAVWFELWSDGAPRPSTWQPPAPPSAAERTVTLVDVPGALYAGTQQHRHVLLRELTLAAAAGEDFGVSPEDLATAHDVCNVISACVTAALRDEHAEGEMYSLPLGLPSDAAPAVRILSHVLDVAEDAARGERLLTLPALPRSRAFHAWLFDQITGQLAGAQPTAWTVVPREPGSGPAEMVPWDVDHVQAARTPTIAADEQNRIIAVNGPAADLMGWRPEDLVGLPLTTLIPDHLRRRHLAAFTSLLLSGEPRILGRSVPLPALHRDGRLVPVRLFLQSREAADGRTVFIARLSPRAAEPAPSPDPPDRRSAATRE